MKEINLPPYAPTLMESTRAIGYSLETAAADIIDNSISAKATEININYSPNDDPYIAILDNGCGMGNKEINIAMQYGSKNPNDHRSADDLGRFGLGLKTASMSQCRRLTVVSKTADGLVCRRWDLDHVARVGAWSLLVLDATELAALPCMEQLRSIQNGTLVIWQNLDRLIAGENSFQDSLGRKMDKVRAHLELVYHRYLSGESGLRKLAIFMNNLKLEPQDPFLKYKSMQTMEEERISLHNATVTVRPYLLPHVSKLTESEKKELGGEDGLRSGQGFYIYRNKRLLIWGTWFRLTKQENLSKLARVQVDIPNELDDLWTLDIKKSAAQPPSEIKKNLAAVIGQITESSKRTWTFRGKRETNDKYEHVWNRMKTRDNGVFYEINRQHPLISHLFDINSGADGIAESVLKQIEDTLPLQQIYVDMNNDISFENQPLQDEKKVEDTLRQALNLYEKSEDRQKFMNSIKFTEPFCNYLFLIDKYMNEEEQK